MSIPLADITSYYEILEVAADSSAQEIREAYLRIKSAYKKNSVALYTLISEDETDALLRQIEDAYQILSHTEKRKEYDRSHGLILNDNFDVTGKFNKHLNSKKIISIDRVPPMEPTSIENDLLVAPKTDFTKSDGSSGSDFFNTSDHPLPSSFSPKDQDITPNSASLGFQLSENKNAIAGDHVSPATIGPTRVNIQPEIDQETDWNGSFIKRVREARNIPLEELSSFTKISKTYITAIEEENFKKLPALVYLRGFLSQISRHLKIPSEKLIPAYLSRYDAAKKS